MAYVLVPGRHHLLSNFQENYLTAILGTPPKEIKDINGNPLELEEPINKLVWAVTSANHDNTRRNPIPGHRREVAIERFGENLNGETYVYLINDLAYTSKFAEYVLKTINVDSLGKHNLSPKNCVVAVSTPSVIEMYEKLGFQILPLELATRDPPTYHTKRCWEILESIEEADEKGKNWRTDQNFLTKTAKATRDLYLKYDYGDLIIELFNDPILGDDGDITDTRDYTTYIESFDKGAHRKYQYVKDYIKKGKIVDIGCATGSIIKEMSNDERLRESDLYGIEGSRQLHSICQQRKENGEFGNEYVFFYHRNIIERNLFPNNSVNTFTAFSLTHELESYSGRETLTNFLHRIYIQLTYGGIFIIYDVIGPENGDDMVLMELNRDDGVNEGWEEINKRMKSEQIKKSLDNLSTYARFLKFAQDFRKEEGYKINYKSINKDGNEYIEISLKDATEFLTKKDYTDNWYSEMHETFCFWNFNNWEEELEKKGFRLGSSSKTFTNNWLIENRYKESVKLLDSELNVLPYPPTNIILLAEKI
jgi:hypothetical protein